MFLEKAFRSSQTTATHRQKGKWEKTLSHASHVSHYLLRPSFNTSHTAVGFHCCCWLWRKQAWLQMGMSDRRWPASTSNSPLRNHSRENLLRETCVFLWPSLFVKHPQEKAIVTPHHHPTKCMQGKKRWGFLQRSACQISKPVCKQVSYLYCCTSIFSSTNWGSN